MLFVCLSHFQLVTEQHDGRDLTGSWVIFISQVASPTFVLISGAMLGFVFERGKHSRELRWRFAERGAFLLLVLHPVLALVAMRFVGGLGTSLGELYVTDLIGLALFLAPLMLRMRPGVRVLLGGAIYLAGWAVVLLARPADGAMTIGIAALGGVVAAEATDGGRARALRWAARLLAAGLIAGGVTLVIHGVFDV